MIRSKWIKRASLVIAFGLLAGISTTASAKTLCIASSGGVVMRFPKVKLPRPANVVPLLGVDVSTAGPVTGSAYLSADGKTSHVQVFESGTGWGYNSLRYEWQGDATLAGTGTLDGNGDNVSDGARVFWVVDCGFYPAP